MFPYCFTGVSDTMPSLVQGNRPFGMVLSRLKKAELLALAGALGLEIAQGATVLHLREITKRKLHDDAPLFIYNPDYQNLYTRRELQDLRRTHPAADETDQGAGPGADNQNDSVSQAASHRQSRSRSADTRSGSARAEGPARANSRAATRPVQDNEDRASNVARQGNDRRGGLESSGEMIVFEIPIHLGMKGRESVGYLDTTRPVDGHVDPCRTRYTVTERYLPQSA
jgi:hypothetical protein